MSERFLRIRIQALVDGYERGMGRAILATDRFAVASTRATKTGTAMSMSLTVAGAAAVKSAMSFESAFTGVIKTTDATEKQLARLRRGIVDMANEVPSTREEIAGIAEAAGQMGVPIQHIEKFTKTIVDLSNATDLVGKDGAMKLSRFMNVMREPITNIDKVGSVIVELGNNIEATESEITDMSLRIGGAAKNIGMATPDILALSAALWSAGIRSEMGGSAMSSTMMKMNSAVASGSKELRGFAEVAGMTEESFATLWKDDPTEGFIRFVEGLDKASKAGKDVRTLLRNAGVMEIRATTAFQSLAGMGPKLRETMKMANDEMENSQALTREAELRYSTFESQVKMTWNKITNAARVAGEVMIPIFSKMLGFVAMGVDAFAAFGEWILRGTGWFRSLAGGIAAAAVVLGPLIFGYGKLLALFPLLVTGGKRVASVFGLMSDLKYLAAARGMSTMGFTAQVAKTQFAGLLGPLASGGPVMWGIAAATAAVAGGFYLWKKAEGEARKGFEATTDSAVKLAESLGLAVKELDELNKEAEDGPDGSGNTMKFRIDNSDAIRSLEEIEGEIGKVSALRSIGYQMIMRGVSPEDSFKAIQQLAKEAGIEVPVSLTVDNLDDFEGELIAVRNTVARAMNAGTGNVLWFEGMRENIHETNMELDKVAASAEAAFKAGDIEGFLTILAESVKILGEDNELIDHLVSKTAELAGSELEIGVGGVTDLETLIEALSNGRKSTAALGQEFENLMSLGMDKEGKFDVALLQAALAAKTAENSALDFADAADQSIMPTAGFTDELEGLEMESDDLSEALKHLTGEIELNSKGLYDGESAAQGFADGMNKATMFAQRFRAGLAAGSAFRSLREGMTGEKALGDVFRDASAGSDSLSKSLERLKSAGANGDRSLSGLETRLQGLKTAGDAFRKAIGDSTSWDEQISGALSLGAAYDTFRRTFRRLPAELDMTALATGKLRKRQAEAVENMLALGKASTDYLGTLIERGKTEGEIQAEATRMRDSLYKQFGTMKLTTEQANKYLEAMGLLPEQVTTAIKLSGAEAARFKLQTYIDLLKDRIPPELATSLVADIDAGNVQQAADRLADHARRNPAAFDVEISDSSVTETQKKINEIKDALWQLPKAFDPMKAAFGGYSEDEHQALDGIMAWGDSVQQMLQRVATDSNLEEVRLWATTIREELINQLAQWGITGDAAERYAELIGLSDWQIESSIKLSGDAEAMARIQLYSDLLGDEIPADVKTEVLTLVDEQGLQAGADRLMKWRKDRENEPINMKVNAFMDFLWPWGKGAKPLDVWAPAWMPGFKDGGHVRGAGSGRSDSVPAMLSNGEHVVTAAAAGPNRDLLDRLNATGQWPVLMARSPDQGVSGAGGVSIGEVNVVAPSPERVPEQIARKVGSQVFLEGI